MKTVVIQAMLSIDQEWKLVDVIAHPTTCPYLFARKGYAGYILTHIPSGMLVMEYIPTLKEAKVWAARLAAVADFAQSVKELKKNTALSDIVRKYRQDWYNR